MITKSKAVLRKVNKAINLANKRNREVQQLKDNNIKLSFVRG